MSQNQNWFLLILRFNCDFKKCVMWRNSTFCKIFLQYVLVIFQTVLSIQFFSQSCLLQFVREYLILFLIVKHSIFSQNSNLNFDFFGCFDINYCSTFFIHKNVHTNVRYRCVLLKWNILFEIIGKLVEGKKKFLYILNLKKLYSLCKNIEWKLAKKLVMT